MGKLLKILVFVLLLLSIFSLVLGTMLFGKRELLKGRTQKLEDAVIKLGATVEAEAPTVEEKPEYPAKDTSPVTSEVVETPELSDFWDGYDPALEVLGQPTMDLGDKRVQLMTYFKVDPITGSVMKDPATGYKVTSGEGTMQEVLDNLLAKSESQYNRLNETREQLKSVREELVQTIQEVNTTKEQQRKTLKQNEELEEEANRQRAEAAKQRRRAEDLEEEKQIVQDQVAQLQRQVALMEEQKAEREAKIEQLNGRIAELEGQVPTDASSQKTDETATKVVSPMTAIDITIQPGIKGEVIAVQPEWNFAVIELSDEFLSEILPEDAAGPIPAVELLVKRPGKPEVFVTKLRLRQLRRSEKLGIADILTDWQQRPVQKGDVVFF